MSFLTLWIFTGVGSEVAGIQQTVDQYYEDTNMADVWIYSEKIDNATLENISSISTTKTVERQLVTTSTANISGNPTLSLHFIENNTISKYYPVEGDNIEMDDDVMDDKIPRITLQPIVENAISHGLRSSKKDSKCIWIRGYHKDGNLLIEIKDNGVGMDAAKINEDLKLNSLERVEAGNSIGILNVNARIKKAFGTGYGLFVESVENEGTTVTITLPVRKEDEIESAKL